MNVRDELLAAVGDRTIQCAMIGYKDVRCTGNVKDCMQQFYLYSKRAPHQYKYFLELLNFSYGNTSLDHALIGTVWLDDGAWLEHAGQSVHGWREHKACPKIPQELI